MKITTRIWLLIIGSGLALMLAGALGIWKINDAERRFDDFTDNILPTIQLLNDSKQEMWQVRVLLWKHLADTDPARKTQYEAEMNKHLAAIDQNFNDFARYPQDDKDKALQAHSRQIFQQYRQGLVPMLAMSNRGESQAAIQLALHGRASELFSAWDEHIHYNDQMSKQTDDANASATQSARQQFVLIVLGALLLLVAGGSLLVRTIRRGLTQLQGVIGEVGRDLDFSRRVAWPAQDEIGQTASAFDGLIQRLQQSLQQLQSGIVDVSTASQHLLSASQEVAGSADRQSQASAHIAAAVEEMTVSLGQVADRANEAQALSADGAQRAEAGEHGIELVVADIGQISDTVTETAAQMEKLAERSKSVESVVSVIRDVADQTNLLALNAAIEAARAGESGRGFAVVADEVRKLAERTAASTQEISRNILAIQQVSEHVVACMAQTVEQVDRGQQGVQSAREHMLSMKDGARQSARVVAEISNAMLEQSAATRSIAQQVEQVAREAEANSHSSGVAAGLATSLEDVSRRMRQEASCYRV